MSNHRVDIGPEWAQMGEGSALKTRITSLDRQEEILRRVHRDLFKQGANWVVRVSIIEAVHKLVATRIKLLREYWS